MVLNFDMPNFGTNKKNNKQMSTSSAAAKRQARLQSSEEVMLALHNVSPVFTAGGSFQEPAQVLAKFASHSGTMSKQSKKWSMIWRKRFCLLMPDGYLYYFSSPSGMHKKY